MAEAPPPTFSGGGKWEATDLGGPSIIVLDGLSKPKRTAAAIRDYGRILKMKEEFLETRSVLR